MSQISKQLLGAENQSSFPNNTTGYISPELLRNFNTDMIDSTVNQTVYTADSTSFDSRVDSLEAFSSSLLVDYINQTELNAATQSLSASLTTTINTKLPTSTFNSYTASTNSRVTTLENKSAFISQSNVFNQDNTFQQQVYIGEDLNVVNNGSFTGSISASGLGINGDTILGGNNAAKTTVKGNLYVTNLFISGTSFQEYSASIASASAFIASYTGQPFNLFSQSVDLRLDNLELFSSSLSSTYATDSELAAVSAAVMVNYNTFSASQYKSDSSSFESQILTNSASFASFSSSQYITDSASFELQILTNSASFTTFSSSQYITDSSSFDSRLDSEEFKSTTFATTGSNTFVGNQIITGSLIISSSVNNDLIVSGNVSVVGNVATSASTGTSTVVAGTALTINSPAQLSSALYGRNIMRQNSGSNAMGMAANPSQGNWVPGLTNPSILTYSGSQTVGNYYGPIQFQGGEQYTDGRVTIKTPLVVSSSVYLSGSTSGQVGELAVVSNTASIDMSKGNFFTLSIPSAANTYITATNIQAGQTIAVKLTQQPSTTGSVTFDSSKFKFWSGSASYNTGSQVTGSTDIFTCVTFDTTSLWTTIVKNLV